MPAPLARIGLMAEILFLLGDSLVKAAQEKFKRAPLPRGATLRPGADTPLWLGLTEMARPLPKPYGAKALLSAELGVSRGRISEYFTSRTVMPDAERTLRLLAWLGSEKSREPLQREPLRRSHRRPHTRRTKATRS